MQIISASVFLSDIVSGNGKLLLQSICDGKLIQDRKSKWQWPRQPRPPKAHWQLWDIILKEVWAKSETRCLSTPLGDWLNTTHQQYKFLYSAYENAIFESFTNGNITKYQHTPTR